MTMGDSFISWVRLLEVALRAAGGSIGDHSHEIMSNSTAFRQLSGRTLPQI